MASHFTKACVFFACIDSGRFQLKRGGNKPQPKGSVLEEAITVAITAMNEPKTCSTTLLRKHLLDSHKDVKEHHLSKSVLVLKRDITVHVFPF